MQDSQLEVELQGERIASFKTNLPDHFKLMQNEFSIPVNLDEIQLSQMILAILKQTNEDLEYNENVKFDFLINDIFLKSTLSSHLVQYNILSEQTLTIYYTVSLNKPNLKEKSPEEDWISSIVPLSSELISKKSSPFLVTLFNGSVSLYNRHSKQLQTISIGEEKVIKTSSAILEYYDEVIPVEHNSVYLFGLMDSRIQIYSGLFNQGKGQGAEQPDIANFQLFAETDAHTASIQTLDINAVSPNLFCSSDFAGNIGIFDLKSQENLEQSFKESDNNSRKKKQTEVKTLKTKNLQKVHNDSISKCLWYQNNILSASLDHTIKETDPQTLREVNSYQSQDSAVTALEIGNDFFLSGHEDGYIKLWDQRDKPNERPFSMFKSHTTLISDIKVHKLSPNIFLSTSYDHSTKIWDLRSEFPLYSMKTHHDKIFASLWNGSSKIITGGSDSVVATHEMQEFAI